MADVARETAYLYSTLCGDPDLEEIVEMFVAEMPERIANFLNNCQTGNREALKRYSHQIKGAAGSYGFDSITTLAARLEDRLREDGPEAQIREAVDDLVDLCRRARARPAD